MSGPGQPQVNPEHLDLKLEAAFTRLIERTVDEDTKETLVLNRSKLVENEVVSAKALQGLTLDELMACGLSKAAATALKVAFPTPTTAGAGGAAGGSGGSAEHKHSLSNHLRSRINAGLRQLCAALLEVPTSDSKEFLILPSSLPGVLPKPLRKSIYVRPLYRDVLATIKAAGKKAGIIITGNPGVGKSAMAPLLIQDAAHQHLCVVYAYKHDVLGDLLFKLDFTDPAAVCVDVGEDNGGLRHKWAAQDNSLLILDGKAPGGHHSGCVRTIVLSSPTVEHWNEYRKGSDSSTGAGVKVLYLDVWHPVEVEKARARLYPLVTADVAAERYLSFGGCVRLVLADQDTSWGEVSKQFGAEHVEQLGNLQLLGFRSSVSHNLVHIRAGRTLEMEYIQLASHKVAHLVLKLLSQQERDKVRKMLVASAGQTAMAGWLGMVFEQHGHVVMPRGLRVYHRQLPRPASDDVASTSHRVAIKRARFQYADELHDRAHATHHYAAVCTDKPPTAGQASTVPMAALVDTAQEGMRQLLLGPTSPPSGQQVELPPLHIVWVTPGLDLSAHSNCYLQPVSTNNAAWDAVICMTRSNGSRWILILQYTLSSAHGVRAGPIVQLLQALQVVAEDTVHMVFVVPDVPTSLYEDYRYQPWLGVQGRRLQKVPEELAQLEQWVLQLPFFPEAQLYSPPSSAGHSSGAAGAAMEDEVDAGGQ